MTVPIGRAPCAQPGAVVERGLGLGRSMWGWTLLPFLGGRIKCSIHMGSVKRPPVKFKSNGIHYCEIDVPSLFLNKNKPFVEFEGEVAELIHWE